MGDEGEVNLAAGGVPSELEVPTVVAKMLRSGNLGNLTLRKIMKSFCDHFDVSLEELGVGKKYESAAIEAYVKCIRKSQEDPGTSMQSPAISQEVAADPLTEGKVAAVLEKIGREEDQDNITLRKLKDNICEHFGVVMSAHKTYIRVWIEGFVENVHRTGVEDRKREEEEEVDRENRMKVVYCIFNYCDTHVDLYSINRNVHLLPCKLSLSGILLIVEGPTLEGGSC